MNNIFQPIISRVFHTTNQWINTLPNKIVLFAVTVIALIAAAFIALRHYFPHGLRNHSAVPLQPQTPPIDSKLNDVANRAITTEEVPVQPQSIIPENALPSDNVRAEAIKYGAKGVTIAWSNQSKEGFRAGCTRNSLGFLASGKEIDFTPESLTDFIQRGLERGILPPDAEGNYGMDDPSELLMLDAFSNLMLVDAIGEATYFPIQVNLDVEGREHQTLTSSVQSLIDSMDHLIGFTISAGTETFAVRFRPNRDVEFFDPHGDSTQQDPSFIFTFDRDDAAGKISTIILDRCLVTIQLGIAGGGVNLCPCAGARI
jgi:hypothetical protein